ncbi:MAG: hypothetical protein WCK39_11820 [Methanomassiliicoccales archaeon]
MTKVSVGEHLWVNVSRKSLCDNCAAQVCLLGKGSKQQCSSFRSLFLAMRKCDCCGKPYEVFENFRALDLQRCRDCNLA